ncbi:MAG: hypothetical protein AB9835_03825 [Eubacteriales bacterium]
MQREKLLIGAFGYYGDVLCNDDKFKDLMDFGADFIVATQSEGALLELCEKHGMPVIINGRIPSWWGGDGENAGKYHEKVSPSMVAEYLDKLKVGETVLGDYIVDEPNSKDFVHINEVMKAYSNYYGGTKIPFVNLYPNYASIPQNTDEEAISQLGNSTYLEHIEQYDREIDNDYICFDFYPFTGRPYYTFLQNLDEVGDVCRKSGRDMWVIIQTGAWRAEELLLEFQIRWQSYLSLAYGTKIIVHACYRKHWWDDKTSCVDSEGNKNITYYYAQNVNKELHALSDIFMGYSYLGAYAAGDMDATDKDTAVQLNDQNIRNAQRGDFKGFDGVEVTADGGVLTGCFENANKDKALLLVNCKNPRDIWARITAQIKLQPGQKVAAYIKGQPHEMTADEKGILTLQMASGEGIFLTI